MFLHLADPLVQCGVMGLAQGPNSCADLIVATRGIEPPTLRVQVKSSLTTMQQASLIDAHVAQAFHKLTLHERHYLWAWPDQDGPGPWARVATCGLSNGHNNGVYSTEALQK